MSTHTTDDETHDRTDCERCGGDRPADPNRYAVAVTDFTDSDRQFERALLCRSCWEDARGNIRGGFA